jgi:hypothetical protein
VLPPLLPPPPSLFVGRARRSSACLQVLQHLLLQRFPLQPLPAALVQHVGAPRGQQQGEHHHLVVRVEPVWATVWAHRYPAGHLPTVLRAGGCGGDAMRRPVQAMLGCPRKHGSEHAAAVGRSPAGLWRRRHGGVSKYVSADTPGCTCGDTSIRLQVERGGGGLRQHWQEEGASGGAAGSGPAGTRVHVMK